MPTSSVVVKCQPWFYLRLVAYSFFWLSEGGIWFTKRLVVLTAHSPPERGYGCSPSTRASEGTESSPEMNLQGNVSDAQAACCFKCSASKPTPFFQTTKVMEAILRASVSRAIEGLTPRARQAS